MNFPIADKMVAAARARYRASPLPGFLAWWSGELRGLVPAGWRRRLVLPRPRLLIRPDGAGGFTLHRGDDEASEPVRLQAGDDLADLRAEVMTELNRFEDGRPEIRLCLPADEVLESRVELPQAVESNLDRALEFQLDQITPFRADQVYFDYTIAGRDSARGMLDIRVSLVPRSVVDELLEKLHRVDLRPHAVDIDRDGDFAGLNLMPEADRPRYVHRRARINLVLGTAAVLLLAGVMAQSLYLRENTVETLQAEAEAARTEAREVLDMRQQLEDALLAANFLAERRRRQPVAMEVLAEVTRIIPGDIWLQQFRINGTELHIQGQAERSQRLIELINDSPLLDEAEFRGAITTDSNTGKERFNTYAQIETPGGEDADPSGS